MLRLVEGSRSGGWAAAVVSVPDMRMAKGRLEVRCSGRVEERVAARRDEDAAAWEMTGVAGCVAARGHGCVGV